MAKTTNEFSAKINELTRRYEEKVKETQEKMNGLSMYSDEEISNRRTAMLKDLDAVTAEYNNSFNETVQQFLTIYALELPDDGKDHAADISNALQIINILGYNLDVKNLSNVIEPMAKSFKSVKTICDLILTKNSYDNINSYSPDIIGAVLEYSGASSGLADYAERVDMLKNVCDKGQKYKYALNGTLSDKVVSLRPEPSYNAMSTANWLDEAAEMYNTVTNSNLFK